MRVRTNIDDILKKNKERKLPKGLNIDSLQKAGGILICIDKIQVKNTSRLSIEITVQLLMRNNFSLVKEL